MSRETFGQVLRRMRDDRGWSLRTLGVATTYDYTHLSNVERGRAACSRDLAVRCDEALGAHGALLSAFDAHMRHGTPAAVLTDGLEFAPTWQGSVEVVAGLWRGDMERRQFVRGATFSAGAFLAPAMRWLTAPLDEQPTGRGHHDVDEPDVDTIRQMTATWRALDNQYGGAVLRETVVRYLGSDVSPLLRDGRFSPTTGRTLFAAAAELTQLAGWMSYDAGMHGLAQRYLIQALRLATAASDRPLGAEILAAMSHQAAYLRQPNEAVDLARAAARTAADAGIPALVAGAAVVEAHGHAVRLDEAACAAALDRAERALDKADRSRDPAWIGYFDEAYLAAKFGHCFAALGRGDLAERFAVRSLDMDPRYVRGRQFNLALHAVCLAQQNDVDQAAAVGLEAVDLAAGLRSTRAVDYVRDLADRLAPHVGIATVDDFRERAAPLLARG